MRKFETRRDEHLVWFVLRTWNEATGKWDAVSDTEYCKTHNEWKLYLLEVEFKELGVSAKKIEEFKDTLRAIEEENERYAN